MKQQNTQYFAGLVRQLIELSNKSSYIRYPKNAVYLPNE